MAVSKGVVVDVLGLPEVQKTLKELAPNASVNLLRSAVHGVASEIAKLAKQKAPKESGTLRKAIKAKRGRPRQKDKPFSDVIVTQGPSEQYDAFYWRFVEYGTSGGATGPQPARPFIQPAVEQIRGNISQIMIEQVGKRLEKMLARQAKRKGR